MVDVQLTKNEIVKAILKNDSKKNIERIFTRLDKKYNDWALKNIKEQKQDFNTIMKNTTKQVKQKIINNINELKKIDTTNMKKAEAERTIHDAIDNKKLFTMTTRNGRQIKLDYYARMVAQNLVNKNKVNETLAQAEAESKDLVKVSSHSGSCKVCRQFEGRIFSISGNSKKYPKLPDINPHPNCTHLIKVI